MESRFNIDRKIRDVTSPATVEKFLSNVGVGKDEGTKGPMIIEAKVGGHCIHRMYVDGNSTSKIMYEHCFSRLRPKIKNQLVPATTPLIGFSGEIICPIGQIQLLVKIGDEEHSTWALMNFVVVRSPSPYNGIIRRPGVRQLQAVLSTAHGMLKLTVEGGVINLKSSRMVPLECAVVSRLEGNCSATKQAVEERVKVAINPEYPEQTVMIGSTLTEAGHSKLCDLLQRNLDIFAWKPADMTGVPRHIAEHRLNMREGCSPVRQKKRGQAADRNQAIQEEVGKLVEAGIMKEVHYHDWLSNPMMMSFGLRNARVTYQRLVDKAFHKQIGRNLEVYVDDLVIKIHTEDEIVRDIKKTFKTLREINMKLNPKKYAFGVEKGMFLGYKVNTGGLKVCPDKVDAILNLPSLKCLKDVQKLNGKLASQNRFLAKSAEKSLPPRVSVKGQILADFIVERPEEDSPNTLMEAEEELLELWILFTDESSCTDSSGAGLILTNPEGMEFTYALRFRFDATNNEAEYKALIAGLRIAKQMGVKNLQANVDSRLVANQVNGTYIAKEADMIRYLEKQVLVEELKEKSISEVEILAIVEEEGDTWMTSIFEYLTEETLPADVKEAREVRRKSQRFAVINGTLYKKSFLRPWLRCVGPLQANYVLREIHEGSCSMHAGTRSVVAKALRIGYYWPTMHKDTRTLIRACQECQVHKLVPRNSQQKLTPITSLWSFYKWGIDIAGPFLEEPRKVKFLIVAIDYFTKWIEAKPVATITGNQIKRFVWDNIVCRFGLS
ncbi:reverse transcriptase domain-containing protein [Tanacetum coccineum]